MRWHWLLIGVAAAVLLFLAYAWLDGGREPLRPITVPVPLPKAGG